LSVPHKEPANMFRVGSGAASFSRMLKTATGTVIQHAGASNAAGRVNRHTCSNAWNAMARHRTGIHSALRRGQQQQQQHITTISRFGRPAATPSTRPWTLAFTFSKRLKSNKMGISGGGQGNPGAAIALKISGARAASSSAGGASASLYDKVMYIPKMYPFQFQSIFAMLKTMAADAVVQIWGEGKDTTDKFDFKRNAVFAAFGFGYLGCAQWFFYVTVMKRLFPNMGKFAEMSWRAKLKDGPGVRALFGQVAFDNLVVTPVFYFPFFYCFKQSIQGDLDLSKMDFVGIGQDAYEKYCANIYEDCIAMWTLFVPGDFIIYSLPIWARLPANHGLSLVWTLILSSMRGDKIEVPAEEEVVVGSIGTKEQGQEE